MRMYFRIDENDSHSVKFNSWQQLNHYVDKYKPMFNFDRITIFFDDDESN